MDKHISQFFDRCARVMKLTGEKCIPDIKLMANTVTNALKNGNKVLLCGNGGSAADAQHISTELVVRLTSKLERKALPAIALTTNTSTLTAAGNDYGFEKIFSRQVEALGNEGDVLIGISTSGNSGNVVEAVKIAKSRGMKTIGFLGGDGGKLKDIVNISVIIPDEDTMFIQHGHQAIGHILCDLVEKRLF